MPEKNKKLKVLACAYACLKDPDARFRSGGEGVLGWNIVKQLARFHRVFVLTHSQNREAIEEAMDKESVQNVSFFYLDLPGPLQFMQKVQGGVQIYAYLWQIKAYLTARKMNRRLRFDVFHHVTYGNDWMASFIGALLPVPYIRGPGGGAQSVPKRFLSELSFGKRLAQYVRAAGQWLFRHDLFFLLSQERARAILVCNREVLRAVPQRWKDKSYLFPVNGVSAEDLALLGQKKREEAGFSVLCAGKLIQIKGFSLAVKAFELFLERFPDTKLRIIGDGPELSRLRSLVDVLGIEHSVEFERWMPREEFLTELASCDVFLFPSLRDGGGAVVVEAMGAGKPVVCLDLGGPGFHVTEGTGIKVVARSPEQAVREMAEALGRLYKETGLRKDLGKRAREKVRKEYVWDKLGERLLEIYDEVLV